MFEEDDADSDVFATVFENEEADIHKPLIYKRRNPTRLSRSFTPDRFAEVDDDDGAKRKTKRRYTFRRACASKSFLIATLLFILFVQIVAAIVFGFNPYHAVARIHDHALRLAMTRSPFVNELKERDRQAIASIENNEHDALTFMPSSSDEDIVRQVEYVREHCDRWTSSRTMRSSLQVVEEILSDRLLPQRDARVALRLRRILASPEIRKCADVHSATMDQYVRVLAIVAEFYYESVRFRTAVYYLHVSKSGGTSMCSLACKNGCRTPHCGLSGNCWSRQAIDGPKWAETNGDQWWVDRSRRESQYTNCLLEQKHLIAKAWNFVANENYLFGGERSSKHVQVCGEFLNIAIVRNPIDRVVSHFRTMRELYASQRSASLTDEEGFGVESVESFADAFYTISNNYVVRLLVGEKDFAKRDLDGSHLEMAKSRLAEFDVVLLTEQLFSGRADSVLRRGVGWSHTNISSLKDTRQHSIDSSAYEPSASELVLLKKINTLDIELYEHAKSLATSDVHFFDAVDDAEDGPSVSLPKWLDTNVSCTRQCGHICNVEFQFDS